MIDKIQIALITALLLWAGTQLVKINSLDEKINNLDQKASDNQDSINELIKLHLGQ